MAFVTSFTGVTVRGSASKTSVCNAPTRTAKWTMDGKGFGGGEATRDPEPTKLDPSDPKSKQTAIHPAKSFAEYQAERKAAEEKKKAEGK